MMITGALKSVCQFGMVIALFPYYYDPLEFYTWRALPANLPVANTRRMNHD